MRDEDIRRFIHDIRNPIGALVGFAHILNSREGQLSDEQRTQVIESILRTSERLAAMVDEFSDQHRAQSDGS